MARVLSFLCMGALFAALLLAPDMLAYALGVPFPAHAFSAFILALCAGGICLAGLRPRMAIAIFALIFFITIAGMLYKSYFGVPLSPETLFSAVANMGSISADIGESLAAERTIWIGALLLSIVILWLYIFAARRFCEKRGMIFALSAALVFIAAPILHIEHNGAYSAAVKPDSDRSTVENSFYTVYATLLRLGSLSHANAQEAHYRIERARPDARNIILIMGESCRYDRMSLFGWKGNTTPRLGAMKKTGTLKAAHGYSAATTTRDSLRVFFNLLYSPEQSYLQQQSNLMALAKAQGYKTFFISAQSQKTVGFMHQMPVDYFRSFQDLSAQYAGQGDDMLFRILDTLPLGERNFIVLHQRSMHSPYETNYTHHPELALYGEEQIASAKDRATRVEMQYDNAMRYNDYVIGNIVETVKKHPQLSRDTTVLFTSDHGEYLGEGGRFGHGQGTLLDASVPYLVSEVNVPRPRAASLFNRPIIAYYDAGEWLAGLMGVTIDNPYKTENTYYLHGSGTLSEYSAIRYHVEKDGSVREEHLSPAAEWVRDKTNFR